MIVVTETNCRADRLMQHALDYQEERYRPLFSIKEKLNSLLKGDVDSMLFSESSRNKRKTLLMDVLMDGDEVAKLNVSVQQITLLPSIGAL